MPSARLPTGWRTAGPPPRSWAQMAAMPTAPHQAKAAGCWVPRLAQPAGRRVLRPFAQESAYKREGRQPQKGLSPGAIPPLRLSVRFPHAGGVRAMSSAPSTADADQSHVLDASGVVQSGRVGLERIGDSPCSKFHIDNLWGVPVAASGSYQHRGRFRGVVRLRRHDRR